MFAKYFARLKAKENEISRQRGYNYAAGQLLAYGPDIYDRLESESDWLLGHNGFDEGMRDALVDYQTQFFRLLSS